MNSVSLSTNYLTTFDSSLKSLIALLHLFGFWIPVNDIKMNPFRWGYYYSGRVWAVFLLGILFLLADLGFFYTFSAIVNIRVGNHFLENTSQLLNLTRYETESD